MEKFCTFQSFGIHCDLIPHPTTLKFLLFVLYIMLNNHYYRILDKLTTNNNTTKTRKNRYFPIFFRYPTETTKCFFKRIVVIVQFSILNKTKKKSSSYFEPFLRQEFRKVKKRIAQKTRFSKTNSDRDYPPAFLMSASRNPAPVSSQHL